jgi:MoxR-like ATPase
VTALPRAPDGDPIARWRLALQRVLLGKPDVVELGLCALLAQGHVLLHDVPGVGKTTFASALARSIGARFARVQFTADLLPADLVGGGVPDGTGGFRFRPGPLFAEVVLADEVNRASPRTQSALLEAMAERQVSVDGQTHPLPHPFFVIATQNPWDAHGAWPLPDSQLDRFLVRLTIGYPDRESERQVVREAAMPTLEPVLDAPTLAGLQQRARATRMAAEVEDWLLDLVRATRDDRRLLRGVSPRGAAALHTASRALAVVRGRDFVIPDDVRDLCVPVLAHRVVARDLVDDDDAGARIVRELVDAAPLP